MAGDVRLIRSPTSVLGMVLTTISAVLFLVVFLADLFGLHSNPYVGIVFFLILPAVFIVGLLLIPLGAWLERRRRAAGKAPSAFDWPRIDLNDSTQRITAVIVFGLTMANVVIVSLAAYRGVEYMDSVTFCGQACHTAMKPEFVAHADRAHARLACIECHVGPGPSSMAKAKLAGTRRLLAVVLNTYPRPIVAAAEQLVPARDSCERCHRAEELHGDKIRRVVEYGDDEQNTESVTTLNLHLGGGDGRRGGATGIHWHTNGATEIEYIAADATRQVIPYVRVKDRQGAIHEYVADGTSPELLATASRRRMDCTDCHNRPSHVIEMTPEQAVNRAITQGDLPRLPFIHRETVAALKLPYASEEVALADLSRRLRTFYSSGPGKSAAIAPDIERAVAGTQDLYRRNVFPDMKVTFGTYPSNIGHTDAAGCFRCHDDSHRSKDGKKIGQECDTCHAIEQ